eukprot:1154527-Pelagomonas_calceolata.AAC.2
MGWQTEKPETWMKRNDDRHQRECPRVNASVVLVLWFVVQQGGRLLLTYQGPMDLHFIRMPKTC